MQINNYLEHQEHLPPIVIESYKTIQTILLQEQKNMEKAILNIIEKNEDIKNKVGLMRTIPGIGEKTAIAFLAETPDLDDFKSARELASYAGLTPQNRQSGTSVHGKSSISKIGSSKLRKTLYFPALVAKNHNPLFTSFNENMSKKGKCAKVIITAIMRKLLHIIFGVLKHNKPFEFKLSS
jgi:transposase